MKSSYPPAGAAAAACRAGIAVALALLVLPAAGRAETREQWISLGSRIHGGFGAFIPVGIRIGLDARARLGAELRGLTVTYSSGEKAPCPCIADGIMLATQASPGQGTLHVEPGHAPAGFLAVAIVRDRRSGRALRYSVADSWLPQIIAWNASLDPAGRYEAAMAADGLFQVEPAP